MQNSITVTFFIDQVFKPSQKLKIKKKSKEQKFEFK